MTLHTFTYPFTTPRVQLSALDELWGTAIVLVMLGIVFALYLAVVFFRSLANPTNVKDKNGRGWFERKER